MREVLGPLLRFLLRPGAVGAAYLSALVAIAARGVGDDGALGSDVGDLAGLLSARFDGERARMAVALGAAAIALGIAFGVAAGLLVTVRDRLARAPRRTPLRRAWAVLGVTATAHAWFVAHAMAVAPQLYAGAWYAQGGFRRTAQVLATDVLGPTGVTVLGVAALVLYLAGPPARWATWPRRWRRALFPLAATGAALLLLRTPRIDAARAAAPGPRMNVLVLAVGSLRADRLEARVAPSLTALASRGTRFDRAYVSLPRTFPSWVTLLTGRHPHHHGIRSTFPRWEERAKDFDALPSHLARAGFRTEVVSDSAGDVFTRIDLGFGRVGAPAFDLRQLVRRRALAQQTPLLPFLRTRPGRASFPAMRERSDDADPDLLADDAIGAIRRGPPGQPFFLTVFFSTAQSPYAAPAPYYRRFTRAEYRGRFKYDGRAGIGAELPPDDEDVAQIRALYDGAVASVDAACARILEALAQDGLADKTIVVLTADHGETLQEAGHGLGHGDHLFGDEGTHVPLVVVDPRRKAGSVRAIARDVDLAPTLYALTDTPPPGDMDGRSLLPAMNGDDPPPVLAFAETGPWLAEDVAGLPAALRLPYPSIARLTEVDAAHGDEIVLQRAARPLTTVAKHRMVRDERWKLVYAPTRMGPKYMLFDTEADPAETRDVAAEHPAELARLKSELLAWLARDPEMRLAGELLVPRDLTGLGAP
jgi:arylsulfatase A-like enzyme